MDHVEKLKRTLEVSGLTQEALADRIGVSFVSINAWINGRTQPRKDALRIIDELYAELAVSSTQNTLTTFTPLQIDQLLSGSADIEIIEALREDQHLKFLQRLESIIDLSPPEQTLPAQSLLARAKKRNSKAYKTALMYPHIATWSAACLQALLTSPNKKTTHANAMHLASIAAVVAWKCGIQNFSIEVPVQNKKIALPSLGRVTLWEVDDATADKAILECHKGILAISLDTETVSLPDDLNTSTHQWEPIRTISVSEGELELHVCLDDVDPYRNFKSTLGYSTQSDRLEQLDYKTWKEHVAGAWHILAINHHEYAAGIAHCVNVLVPIQDEIRQLSAFYRHGFGAIISTIGLSPDSLALGLVEEFQRMKIHALHSFTPLHNANPDIAGYFVPSGINPLTFDNVIESFYSNASSIEFWQERLRHAFGEQRLEAAVNFSIRQSWEESLFYRLSESNKLTALGKTMVQMIHHRCTQVEEVVPLAVIDFTRGLAIDRRISFRLMNIKSHQLTIEQLCHAWNAGMTCPTNKPVPQHAEAPTTHILGWKRRRLLGEMRLSHPEKFNDILENRHYLELVLPGATLADAYVAAERFDDAFRAYQTAIEANPDDLEAWSGLALVSSRTGNVAASTLGRFPEIVADLHRNMYKTSARSEDPLHLAKWLEPLLFRMDDFAFENSL